MNNYTNSKKIRFSERDSSTRPPKPTYYYQFTKANFRPIKPVEMKFDSQKADS